MVHVKSSLVYDGSADIIHSKLRVSNHVGASAADAMHFNRLTEPIDVDTGHRVWNSRSWIQL